MKRINPNIFFKKEINCAAVLLARLQLLFIFSFVLGFFTHAQTTCMSPIDAGTSANPNTNVNCNDYLNDFIPQPTDPVLEIEVVVWVFNDDFGVGYWSQSTWADADNLIDSLNKIYSTLEPPNLVLSPNVPFISHAKIKFHLKTFQIVNNSQAYTNKIYREQNFTDPFAINYFYGTGVQTSVLPPLPNNRIHINAGAFGQHVGTVLWRGEAHEMGHALGLRHTQFNTGQPPYNGTTFINTGEACCGSLVANDYVQEGPGIWMAGGNCGTPNKSNNIMGYNDYCRRYLSPLQLAAIHYHLRTDFRNVLRNISYTNDLTRNPNLDYNVQSNEVWVINKYFKGNVIVKSGKKLEVFCKVGMAKGTYVIVEKGAQLVIGTGGEFTNISGQLWGGIVVEGSSSLGQVVNNTTGFATNQGVARIVNGGKVSQAENGVKNYLTHSNGSINWSTRGGVIIGNGALFENNIRDVEFISYQNPLGNDRSEFVNSTFRTTADFNSTVPPYAHVTMWNTKGIQFKGCIFEYLAGAKYPSDHGRGIHSIDAIYTVDKYITIPSEFNNLSWGVLAGNTNPLKTISIQNSEFTNCEMDAVYLKNMNNILFNNNTINLPYNYSTNGLYLHTCKNYQVKNCQFIESVVQLNQASTGIYVYNSQAGSHQIYKNKFSGLEQGISVIGNNSGVNNLVDGLKLNCNDFNWSSFNKYDIAMLNFLNEVSGSVPATVMRMQGANNNANAYNVIRNKYGAPSSCSTCENKWYIQGTAAKQVIHGSNQVNNADMHPTPQPQHSDIGVNDVPSNIQFNSNHCPENPGTNGGVSPGSAKLIALNDYLRYLFEQHSEENDLGFEIQATLTEKLNYFAADSLPESTDSLIALIIDHNAYLTDSDLLLIYAYMHKGDFTEAQSLAEGLAVSRNAWKELLLNLIDVYTEDDMIYSLTTNTASSAFFDGYALDDTFEGQASAQSLLTFVLNGIYSEPRLHPVSEEEGERRRHEQGSQLPILDNPVIRMYPNPSRTGVFIDHRSEKGVELTIEIRDLTGRLIFTKFVTGSGVEYLAVGELRNGLYLLSVTNNKKELLYKSKLIKQE